MKAYITTQRTAPERVFLVGAELKSQENWQVRDSLDELGELVRTAGGEIAGDGTQRLEAPVPATFIGSGKAEDFAKQCAAANVDTVVFDDELSAAQSRNLEAIFKIGRAHV